MYLKKPHHLLKMFHPELYCTLFQNLRKLLTVLIVTFWEGNGLAEIEENDFNNTPVYDGDAHKIVLCTKSYFLRRLLVIMT